MQHIYICGVAAILNIHEVCTYVCTKASIHNYIEVYMWNYLTIKKDFIYTYLKYLSNFRHIMQI